MQHYIVIREGTRWTDVMRLSAGRTVTIGRAPTNQIVVKDDRTSRYHAEIFHSDLGWTLRDLDSRNGTLVGSVQVRGDYTLSPGDVIRIAHCQLAFVNDLATAFPDSARGDRRGIVGDDTVLTRPAARNTGSLEDEGSAEDVLDFPEPTTITHRRGHTKFLESRASDEDSSLPKLGQAASKLCRLAFELAKQRGIAEVAQLALKGLFESTHIDAGAVLLLPRGFQGSATGSELEIVASHSTSEPSYYRISRFLAAMVMRDGEAVLARNVENDSTLGSRDSKGEIHATSVMCAPIRQDGRALGLIHLYSTRAERVPDADDLDFALAVADNVALAIKNFSQQQELSESLSQSQSEIQQLRKRLGAESEIVGESPQMMRVHQDVARAAPSRATVLIRGESGVGKELVARAVHFASSRQKGPFVCLNCAALSESLLESELFGHEKGSFTGATERKIGKFESAHGGTLMLDEIGEMSPAIQAKFLRVLEGHPFERVGGSQPIKVDVRVIAATNRNLEEAVAENTFRRDLYFRLRVVEIGVPPLRKRPDDVLRLANHFLDRFRSETGRRIRGYTTEATQVMLTYRWPGNVRELKNVVERAVLLARGEFIDVDDLTLSNLATSRDSGEIAKAPSQGYEPVSLDELEKRHILATLKETNWNKSRTATILGIERSTLDRKIRRYEISTGDAHGG